MTSTDQRLRSARPRGRRGGSRLAPLAALPLWVQSGAVYLAIRFVSWVLLQIAAGHQQYYAGVTGPDADHVDLALNWDAYWYERIEKDGYPSQLPVGPDGRVQQNPWAFYPAFPYTVRAVMAVTGASFATVAPLLALLAGLAAAVVMAHLFRATLPAAGRKAGAVAVAAVAVWAAFPSAPVLQLAYTESFAMLLLVSFLLFVVKDRWWAAGVVALLLGLTRPIALPLSVVVLVSAFMRMRRGRMRPAEAAGMGFAVVATGLSGLLWTAVAWWGTGQRDAYTSTMTAWRGAAKIDPITPWKHTITYAYEFVWGDPPFDKVYKASIVVPAITIVVAIVAAAVLLIPRVAPQVDLRLRVWTAAYAFYLLAVVDGGTSIIRYLVPMFPLALAAVGAHRPRRAGPGGVVSPRWELRTAFWVVAGFVGQIGWIWWLLVFKPLPGGGDFPP